MMDRQELREILAHSRAVTDRLVRRSAFLMFGFSVAFVLMSVLGLFWLFMAIYMAAGSCFVWCYHSAWKRKHPLSTS